MAWLELLKQLTFYDNYTQLPPRRAKIKTYATKSCRCFQCGEVFITTVFSFVRLLQGSIPAAEGLGFTEQPLRIYLQAIRLRVRTLYLHTAQLRLKMDFVVINNH